MSLKALTLRRTEGILNRERKRRKTRQNGQGRSLHSETTLSHYFFCTILLEDSLAHKSSRLFRVPRAPKEAPRAVDNCLLASIPIVLDPWPGSNLQYNQTSLNVMSVRVLNVMHRSTQHWFQLPPHAGHAARQKNILPIGTCDDMPVNIPV